MLVARVRLADGLNNTAGMAEAVHLVRAVLGGRQLPCAGNGSAGADDDTLLVECELGTAGGTVRFALLSVPIAGGSVVVASTASGSSGQDNLGAHGGLYIVVLCLGVLVLIVLVLGVVALRRRYVGRNMHMISNIPLIFTGRLDYVLTPPPLSFSQNSHPTSPTWIVYKWACEHQRHAAVSQQGLGRVD